jgi:hypothetical protein
VIGSLTVGSLVRAGVSPIVGTVASTARAEDDEERS